MPLWFAKVRVDCRWMQDMTKVSSHFVRGNDPKKFASMLANFMGKVMVFRK
jgi:hypothetical protein